MDWDAALERVGPSGPEWKCFLRESLLQLNLWIFWLNVPALRNLIKAPLLVGKRVQQLRYAYFYSTPFKSGIPPSLFSGDTFANTHYFLVLIADFFADMESSFVANACVFLIICCWIVGLERNDYNILCLFAMEICVSNHKHELK